MNDMPWKTRLLLAVLALGTVAGYGSALARARHWHGGPAQGAACERGNPGGHKLPCACAHGGVDQPGATP